MYYWCSNKPYFVFISLTDKLVHYKEEESRHLVVYRRGRWYKVDLTKGKRLLNAAELEQLFQQVRISLSLSLSFSLFFSP